MSRVGSGDAKINPGLETDRAKERYEDADGAPDDRQGVAGIVLPVSGDVANAQIAHLRSYAGLEDE
jgi:hypothetical protein